MKLIKKEGKWKLSENIETDRKELLNRIEKINSTIHTLDKREKESAKRKIISLQKDMEKLDKKINAEKYSHKDIKKIFKKIGLESSKSKSSGSIRGFSKQTRGYEIDKVVGDYVKLYNITVEEFETILNEFKKSNINISSSKGPFKSVNGFSYEIVIKNNK